MFQKVNDWLQRSSYNSLTETQSTINTVSTISETQDSLSDESLSKIINDLGDISMDDSKSFANSAKDS
ncbi:hypothetical protein U3516DRAFT_765885, partial [Neocallimastix sp. 'constans']